MVCELEVVDGTIRVNCAKCMFGSSLEDFDVCFARTIDKILEVKKVEKIVLVGTREYEYDYEQTKLLVEIAEAYNKLINVYDILEYSKLGAERCERCFPKRFAELKFLLTEMLRKDPIGAYVKVRRMIRYNSSMMRKENVVCRRCYDFYLKNALIPIKETLENTTLIKMVKDRLQGYMIGDRAPYRDLFHPFVKPAFMLTRYETMPPEGGKPLERYILPNGISVEVYKVPGLVRSYYYISAPEFRLSDEKYSVLDAARQQLAEHKPTEKEFTQPEMARETFMNMGKDILSNLSRESGLRLSEKELDELANILARYTAGFGILEVLLADEKIQDIYINSPIGNLPIYILHDDWEECETNLIPTREDAEGWATRFRLLSGRPLDEANPVLDTELFVPGAKARVCAITSTLSPEGIGYALRRHRERPWTYPLFLNTKYFDPLFAGLMSFFVDGSRTLLIAGGRSSGKTSLLSASILEIMKKFRVVTVEDTLEIPIIQLRNLGYNIERLRSRSVITRIEREMPADEALRTAIRLGDACLIVGEVRSVEALALFEAMRIGALSNVVAGTIHGESAYGVFDRIVNDLKVPPASFKATDIIAVCGRIKTADGLHTFRRVLEVTEVRKQWKEDPSEEGGFVNLMEYSAKEDKLKPTDTLINGESLIINEIAKRVKEWHGNWDAVWSNIELRGRVKQTIVDYSNKLKRSEILEADWTSKCNEMFHLICDDVRKEVDFLDSKIIYDKWLEWFKGILR
jgi:type IV secretory pathway ATPase VirB11/archaellum biosynthesis ATPase